MIDKSRIPNFFKSLMIF